MKSLSLIVALFFSIALFAQETSVKSFDAKNINWFDKDFRTDKVLGASVEKAYQTILRNFPAKDTIIVAVIDGGVDIRHKDLAGKIWNNPDEIAGNNLDDDKNGYVDDIHGWNFIGSKSGENIRYENYEYTRVLKNKKDSVRYYSQARELFDEGLKDYMQDSITIGQFEEVYQKAMAIVKENTGIDVKSIEDVKRIPALNKTVVSAKKFLYYRYANGFTENMLAEFKKRNQDDILYHLNMGFNPRLIVGDDPENINDRDYGNNNVIGPQPSHGTSVSGVIAANGVNDEGVMGIARAVKIMPIRVVPDGDERDKDIALAIMYAVDNGARIINMSFGKAVSPNKEFVDQAFSYALKHNVLLVHAAGNESTDIDITATYPSDMIGDSIDAPNLIKIGASGKRPDKTLAAGFTNYGKQHVDIFAPGVDIVSLDSCNLYGKSDGTSLAAPVVTGVAAVILSCYPQLTPQQLIDVLMEGAKRPSKSLKVVKPEESKVGEKVLFSELSRSGGIVNLYNSLKIAQARYSN